MLRQRRRNSDLNSVAAAVEALERDGAAAVTVETLKDLSVSEAAFVRERWSDLADDLRHAIITQMALLSGEDVRMNFERVFMIGLADANPDIRLEATGAMWEVESTALLAALLQRLEHEPEARVRVVLVEALGRFAGLIVEGGFETDRRDDAESLLVDVALDDENEDVRLAGLAAAAYFRPTEIEAEIAGAYDDGHDEAKEIALRAMGRFGGRRWASRVIDGLAAGDEEQRLAAAAAAPYVEDRRVLPYLFEAAEDDDGPELQLAAILALGNIGGTHVQSFLETLKDSTAGDAAMAAEAALESAALLEGLADTVPIH
jgi:HEAT repeat protein